MAVTAVGCVGVVRVALTRANGHSMVCSTKCEPWVMTSILPPSCIAEPLTREAPPSYAACSPLLCSGCRRHHTGGGRWKLGSV